MTEENQGLIFTHRDELVFKVCITTNPQIDTTKLLREFIYRRFAENYKATLGVDISKGEVIIENHEGNNLVIFIMIWDIAGQPQFYMLHRPYFNGSDGAIIIYDVSNLSSLNFIPKRIRKIRKYTGKIPIFLLGIKTNPDVREIPKEKVVKITEHFNLSGIYEVSLENVEIIQNIFKQIAEVIYQSKLNPCE